MDVRHDLFHNIISHCIFMMLYLVFAIPLIVLIVLIVLVILIVLIVLIALQVFDARDETDHAVSYPQTLRECLACRFLRCCWLDCCCRLDCCRGLDCCRRVDCCRGLNCPCWALQNRVFLQESFVSTYPNLPVIDNHLVRCLRNSWMTGSPLEREQDEVLTCFQRHDTCTRSG